MYKALICCFSLLIFVGCFSNINMFSVAGTFEQKTAQGMAIYRDDAVLINDYGVCRIYDMKRDSIMSKFHLASYNPNNHCNCADFGNEKPVGNREYPALYISECKSPGRCFVESITQKGSTLIQTIQFKERVTNWIVDKEHQKIYGIARYFRNNKATDSISIWRFRLPLLTESDIMFKADDVEKSFKIPLPYVLQGATIRNNKMYIPVGLQIDAQKSANDERNIIIVDLNKEIIEKRICIEQLLVNEPEDVDFYKGKLLLFCGQSGGISPIPLK